MSRGGWPAHGFLKIPRSAAPPHGAAEELFIRPGKPGSDASKKRRDPSAAGFSAVLCEDIFMIFRQPFRKHTYGIMHFPDGTMRFSHIFPEKSGICAPVFPNGSSQDGRGAAERDQISDDPGFLRHVVYDVVLFVVSDQKRRLWIVTAALLQYD